MPDTNWIMVGASLLGGGAVGAIITQAVTIYRARKPAIGYVVSVDPILQPRSPDVALSAVVKVQDQEFDNLFRVQVKVVNRSNKDLSNFHFGATFQRGDRVISVEPKGVDRHHVIEALTPVEIRNPQHELDFVCTPFNRDEVYTVNMFVVDGRGSREPQKPQLGTREAVDFRPGEDLNRGGVSRGWFGILGATCFLVAGLPAVPSVSRGESFISSMILVVAGAVALRYLVTAQKR